MTSLSEMVRRRYPHKKDDLDVLRTCQWKAVKGGALAFVAMGGLVFLGGRTYARRVDPTFHRYILVSSIVSASVASAATSFTASQACLHEVRAKNLAKAEKMKQEQQGQQGQSLETQHAHQEHAGPHVSSVSPATATSLLGPQQQGSAISPAVAHNTSTHVQHTSPHHGGGSQQHSSSDATSTDLTHA
ncbi:hypothetical protein PTSG_02128 [Salpingoeca rosetta]|uniref:Uncharacterized protein n=1 Tax=Salpingoeca rosetta (strain ATCC 50818 / BSB-021) TaxID=946362 RepID=F2U1A4_SALR5|nr:uncharacterized protein PTSG_02128 [Salpingoeca rosetta]EGD81406.1 hypothetical protein PTSG_02128 [Salpingoeca rosetta]|eukprot:XP_004996610.1 hypothetical protein PTSG_02128 [Salpingoeca rosetta]